MNLNQAINLFMRLFGRRLLNRGINKAIDSMARGKSGKPATLTPKQAKTTREAVKRARQAARLTRRIGR